MAQHVITCPKCAEELLLEVAQAVGGSVQEAVSVLDHRSLEAPKATAAAAAHAEELGVDLGKVEGSGAGGTITKSDVAAAAGTSNA